MRKMLKRILLMALALMLCCAAVAEDFDIDRKGSISVLIHTNKDVRVQNARLELYRVGDPVIENSNLTFQLTADFASSGANLFDLNAAGLANTLAETAKNVAYVATANTDKQGQVSFDDLDVGLYLVVQNGFTKKMYFSEIAPFIVSVPMSNDAGTGWNYHIDASPKVNTKPKPTAKPSTTAAPGDEPLPQTGMLRWPIPVLGLGGLLIFCLGWVLCFMRKNKKDA